MNKSTGRKHGTISTYTNGRCRCDACREAWRVHHRKYMARSFEQRLRHAQRQRERYHAGNATNSPGRGYVAPSRLAHDTVTA